MRNAVRKLRATTDKAAAVAMYPGVAKLLDKLAKTNVIHKNKASNLKSKLSLYMPGRLSEQITTCFARLSQGFSLLLLGYLEIGF